MKYVIGVDSGGTHIVGQALTLSGSILAQTQSGPGNILLDQSQTLINLKTVLTNLLIKLGESDCEYILMGIAGVETTGNSESIAKSFTSSLKIPTYVVSDAQLALLNGLEGQDGTLIIAGTGSVIYGRQNQQLLRFGGWGNLLGDTGSAYKIVATAMEKMLHDYDLGHPGQLEPILLPALKATNPKQAVQKYYQLSRKEVAALAVLIATAADDKNPEAISVLEAQAQALANEALGLIGRYQHPYPDKLALSGSVLVHNHFYRQILIDQLHATYPELETIVVATNNARGAIFWRKWHQE